MVVPDRARRKNAVRPIEYEELEENDLLLIEDYLRETAPSAKPRVLADVCVIYGRFSSRSQRDESIDIQEGKGVDYAEKHDWTLRPGQYLFADYAVSGGDLVDRTQLEALRRLARQGGFNRLLIKGVDRLSRRQWQAYMLLEEFAALGIEVHITGAVSHGLLDATTAFIDGFLAMRERQKILTDTKNGLEDAAWRGENVSSIPYGYYKGKTGELIVDEKKKVVVVRILEYFANKMTPQKIAKILNLEGIPSPRGKKWGPGQILGSWASGNGMVRNVKYIGISVYNVTQQTPDPLTGDRSKIRRPRSEWIMVRKPEWRLVSDELWRRVMARLKEITKARKIEAEDDGTAAVAVAKPTPERYSSKSTLLFHDKYFCKCGSRMYPSFSSSKVRTLYCPSAFQHGECERRTFTSSGYVEVEILRALRDKLLSKEAIGLYRETYADGLSLARENAVGERANLTREIEALTRRIDRTWAEIADAEKPDADKERNYRDYQRKRDRLQTRLDGVRVPGDLPDLSPAAIASFKEQVEELILRIPFVESTTADIELVSALRVIVRRVEIDRPDRAKGYDLVIETTLSGLPGGEPPASPESGTTELETDGDAAPIYPISRSCPKPTKGRYAQAERDERLEKLAERGEHALTEEDWKNVAHVLIDYNKKDRRLLMDTALFALRTGQGLFTLPGRYADKALANGVRDMVKKGFWARALRALEEAQSPTVAGLDTSRFADMQRDLEPV